ncbi:hypothetical protein [Streptomyces sp. NPDC005533]|uniref:hypothetical protein n=1 Tax=Streptomyces sp. NPDC005533 TaxID=3364723 RepID=UPI0036861856
MAAPLPLRQLTASGDFAYFVDIARYMGGLPLSGPTTTIWTDAPEVVREKWHALVVARCARPNPAH